MYRSLAYMYSYHMHASKTFYMYEYSYMYTLHVKHQTCFIPVAVASGIHLYAMGTSIGTYECKLFFCFDS